MQDSVAAMMDSLRFQLGDFRRMKEWQNEILNYHIENNKFTELESYTDSLLGCNIEAYNTFGLYLMNNYHDKGQCNHAHIVKQKVVFNNAGDKEIGARAKYFEYKCRQTCDTTHRSFVLPYFTLNPQDSADLANIVYSETSLSEIICMKLKSHYPEYVCNIGSDSTVSNVRHLSDCGHDCKKKRDRFLKRGWEDQTGKRQSQQGAQLSQNIPNPAENETLIPYFIPKDENTTLENSYIVIQNIIDGYEVKRIVLSKAGYKVVTVNLNGLPSGIYTYILVVDGVNQDVKRMVVVK